MINVILKERLVLAYGLDDEEIDKLNLKFNTVCKKPVKVITSDMSNCTLGQILMGQEIKVSICSLPSVKVVILNGFQGVYLQNAVKIIRKELGQEAILASTTPNSVKMPLHELIDHLIQERALYKK